ncbi:Peptidyl-prolyl cis-trans isomerase (rotamase)-cyclophilin family [Arenibacter nanhaiticus]|uniref:Peptidyl-prolyl cis-trans isomerase n=1 Tax=Arenibacter nanhaiticus TaxID=558155 RepID=A0A1M6B7B4_9FLAO|nr:peptidylprolyl isomerase [Arenibacter nanhaiticus]SHI44639.1 Peptidyl-prolyl cis-trans isomerase (rotamase)-cyclophilin family [Arenibacter nanhaiticus]
MTLTRIALSLFFFSVLLISCKESPAKKTTNITETRVEPDTLSKPDALPTPEVEEEEPFKLTEENAIDFFFNYSKTLKEDKVKLTTSFGSIVIQLFDNVPYHKANFIYLTEQGYFNNTYFHRVVKNFIIQGGNADNLETAKKRGQIGRYLLPPDAKKGHKHHRGIVSMPSSEVNNPHKLASPYEFFIVVTKPGSYHLDGSYTPFGKVIEGMDVVDKINQQPVDNGDWPSKNIYILKAEVIK